MKYVLSASSVYGIRYTRELTVFRSMKNSEVILQEIEVLRCIYPDEIQETYEEENHYIITFNDEVKNVVIRFTISENYPDEENTLTVIITHRYNRRKELENKALNTFKESLGEVCIYKILEEIRSSFELEDEQSLPMKDVDDNIIENDDDEEEDPDQGIYENENSLDIIHGPLTTEMKSSFQSHLAEVHSMDDVHSFRRIVLSNKKIARATHNIFAYRFTDERTKIVHHDCDDDGETAAGARLAEMMRLMGVQNVAVIVSRWFGGILLGPDRFKYICNSAKDLLEECGYGDDRKGSLSTTDQHSNNKQQKKKH